MDPILKLGNKYLVVVTCSCLEKCYKNNFQEKKKTDATDIMELLIIPTSDSLVENFAWGSEVEGASRWLNIASFLQVVKVFHWKNNIA